MHLQKDMHIIGG